MNMFSCFGNCHSLSKKKDSDGKQKGESNKEPIVIGGCLFTSHEQTRRGSTYECKGCQKRGFEHYYLHTSDGRNIHYHQHCGDILRLKSPLISNHHPYPVGRYNFKERAPSKVRYCVACGDQVQGLRYKVWSSNPFRCLDNRDFHPLCATLPPRIQDPGNRVVLKLEERIRGQCPICNGQAKGWAYNSTCGKYSCHVGCMKTKIIQSWQQDEEASENGGIKGRIIVRVEGQLPQIRELAVVAIRLIIEALFGGLIADLFNVFCP